MLICAGLCWTAGLLLYLSRQYGRKKKAATLAYERGAVQCESGGKLTLCSYSLCVGTSKSTNSSRMTQEAGRRRASASGYQLLRQTWSN